MPGAGAASHRAAATTADAATLVLLGLLRFPRTFRLLDEPA
jgi:hypothetical protein